MFLIVDTQPQRKVDLELQLKDRGAVQTCGSWSEARKLLGSKDANSLKYVFLTESVLKTMAHPQKELSSFKEFFHGLWVMLSEDPHTLFKNLNHRLEAFAVEYWSPEVLSSKIEFLTSVHLPEVERTEKSLEGLVSQRVSLSETGILQEKPSSSFLGCFSPEGYARGDLMVLARKEQNFQDKVHQMFSFATSGALREVYQRVQKDEDKSLIKLSSGDVRPGIPSAVWVTSEPSDLDSLAEFFPGLPLVSLPHLGVESGAAASSKGQKDFFFDSKPGQLASFKLDREELNVLGLWGSELKGFPLFLGHSLAELNGTSILKMISGTDRDRFLEVIRRLETLRPIVNYFELLDAQGGIHLAELLLDHHRDGDEEFLLLRVNPFVQEMEDHMIRGHQQGLLPPDWPHWVILPVEEWKRVGGSEAVQSRLENAFRRPQGAPDATVWLISKSPLKPADILDLLGSQVECVWTSPLPFRLMARRMHSEVGEPHPDLESLQVHWSSKLHTLYFQRTLEMEQTFPEGVLLQSKDLWQLSQKVLLDGKGSGQAHQGFRWGRVVHCEGTRAKVSWLVQSAR